MKKYGIVLFVVCAVAVQLCAADLPEYEQRRRNLRYQQAEGFTDPVALERERLHREHLYRNRSPEKKQSMLWFVPSKKTRKKMATGAKSKWQSLKKGLQKKKEGLEWFVRSEI